MPVLLGIGLCFFVVTGTASAQEAEAEQATETTRYWARDFSLRNVDSQTVVSRLESLGVEVPFQLDGDVSLDATVWIPFRNLLDATKYRFDATLTSPRLTINAVRLADATIQFQIDEGMLHLRDLRGTLIDSVSLNAAGTLTGTGSAQLVPLGFLELTLQLRDLNLQTASRDIAELESELQGVASGQMTFSHPDITKTGNLQKWDLKGAVDVESFAIDSDRLWDLAVESLHVQNGALRAEGLLAKQRMAGATDVIGDMRGTATAQILPAGPVSLDVNLSQVDLAHATESLNLDVPLSGVANGTVHFENRSLERLDDETAWMGTAALRIAGLEYDGYPGANQQLQVSFGKLTLQDGGVTLEAFSADQFLAATNELVAAVRGSASAQLFPAGPVQVDLAINDFSLHHATASLNLDVPLAGLANGTVHFENPNLERLDDETAWTGTAALRIDRLEYGDYPGADQQLQVSVGKLTLRDGTVTLDEFSADQFVAATNELAAAVRGSASASLFPAGPVQFDLTFNDVALESVGREFLADSELAGTAEGSLRASNPRIDRVDVWSDWTGNGQLAVDSLTIGNRPPIAVAIPQYAFDPQGISMPQLALRGERWQASAEAEYAWPAPHSFRFRIATAGIPTPELFRLVTGRPTPDETTGVIAFNLETKGQEDPDTWQVAGELEIPQAKLAGIRVEQMRHQLTADSKTFRLIPAGDPHATASGPDQKTQKGMLRLGRVESQYELDAGAFRVENFFAEVFGGVIEGDASIALDSADLEKPATHRAQLKWQGLDFAATASVAESDFSVQAMSRGNAQWSVAADRFDDPRAHQFQANVDLSSLSLSGEAFGDLSVGLSSEESLWRAAINGTLLGGPAESEFTADIASVSDWHQLARAEAHGTISLRTIDIGRIVAFWQTSENVRQWQGQTDVQWTFRGLKLGSGSDSSEDSPPPTVASADSITVPRAGENIAAPEGVSSFQADGTVRVTGVAYGGRRVTDRLELHLGFDGNTVAVKQFTGNFAGGRLGASGSWRRSGTASGLNLLLTGVDTSRAVLLFSPSMAAKVSGIASGRILLAGQTELRASGQLSVRDMRLDPFRLGTVRSAVDGAFDLGTQQWRVQFRNVAGSVARGRIRGQASLRSSPGQSHRFGLDSRWELDGVDFEKMLGELSTGRNAPGKGKLSGQLTIKGQRIASVADLEGTLDARLDGTEANAVPGLPAARNQLGALSLRNTTFDSGEIRGRFRRGTFHLTELWLDSDQLRVWADGNVSMSSSRWDIDAVVATGNFEQANLTLLALARQVSLDATLPVGMIVRVNEALSDRIVYLRLTGPMSRPQVRIQARQTLGENAARFFLRSLTDSLVPLPAGGNRR